MRLEKPVHFFLIFMFCIFCCEAAIMVVLAHVPDYHAVLLMFADAFALSLLTAPLVYYLFYRPMRNQNTRLRSVTQEMESHRRNLQDLVENREEELRDIHERLRKEFADRNRVDETLLTLSMAVVQSPSIVMITDPKGNITYVNPEFSHVTGFSEQEMLGRNAGALGVDNPEYRTRDMWETLNAGHSWSGEFLNRRKGGATYWEKALISPIRDSGNNIIGYLKTATDETEHKETEEILERNYQFQSVLNHILRLSLMEDDMNEQLQGVLECILFLPFLEVKPRGAIYTADTREQTLTIAAQIGVPDDIASQCRQMPFGHCLCGRAAQEQTTVYSNVCENAHTDSPHGHYCVPLVSANETLGVLCLYLDAGHKRNELEDQFLRAAGDVIAGILRQHRTEAEKESLLRQYHHAQKMEAIGVLAGGVAHDFNNMLTGIQGNADLGLITLKKTNAGGALADFLTQITTITQRASDLTRQLLLFSRKQPVKLEPLDLNQAVESMLKMLSRLISKPVALKADLETGLPGILADRGNMDQLLMNLVVNARDAMPGGGDIRITTRFVDQEPGGGDVRITVSDKGVGMDEHTRQHIFEPFFSTKEQGKGTGLGLAVVYGIVQQHGGRISVESAPGQGSTFTVDFPALQKFAAPGHGADRNILIEGGPERILLLEDDEFVSASTQLMLESAGYRLDTASRLEDAVLLFDNAESSYDLVGTRGTRFRRKPACAGPAHERAPG